MRELFRALSELESRLMQSHGVSLNEAWCYVLLARSG